MIPGQEDPLAKGMATQASILVWRLPWTEESGMLQSVGSRRVGHDLASEQQEHSGWQSVNFHKYLSIWQKVSVKV